MAGLLKKVGVGAAVVVGVAHIGVLGHVMTALRPAPIAYPPVNDYSSYRITRTPDGGYQIEYIGNDPRVLENETNVDQRSGFLGFGGRNRTNTTRQFTQDGARNQNGGDDEGKLTAEDIACIEAAGGGRSSGAIVGGSVAAAAAPTLTAIPYVGWLAAGWATMLGTDLGGDLGAGTARIIQGC